MKLRPRSVRVRLALWYAAALTVVLVAYAAGVFAFLRRSLHAEIDHQLRADYEVAEQMLQRTADGGIGWRAHGHHGPSKGRSVEVRSPQGELLFRRGEPLAAGEAVRTYCRPYDIGGRTVHICVARSEKRLHHELEELVLVMLLGLPLAVAIAGLGGYLLARRALSPIGGMAERARSITAQRLGDRLPVENADDELGQLAAVFNETLARLERSFDALRRFTADASHELRTPLTAIRSVGEVGLQEQRDAGAYREVIGSMLEETDRLARLVDSLLTLSRADGGQLQLQRESVDLVALAREVAEFLGVLAEENGQRIEVEAAGEHLADVDRLVLRQALINLIDNAIEHSPEGGVIRVRVDARSIAVRDEGPGIPAEHRDRIFERFYRVDESRSRERGGSGLGLSIARWAVEGHGGRIVLESAAGEGSTFRIELG